MQVVITKRRPQAVDIRAATMDIAKMVLIMGYIQLRHSLVWVSVD